MAECAWCALIGDDHSKKPLCAPPPLLEKPKFGGQSFLTTGEAFQIPTIPKTWREFVAFAREHPPRRPCPLNIDDKWEYVQPVDVLEKKLLEAEENNKFYWYSLNTNNTIRPPPWWPVTPENFVEDYQEIILSDSMGSIGLHQDKWPGLGTPGPQTYVDSAITIYVGAKRTLIIPPERLTEIFPDFQNPGPFPAADSELAKKIVEVGGYYFDFTTAKDGSPVTIFIPELTWHWLEGINFSVVAGCSIFPESYVVKKNEEKQKEKAGEEKEGVKQNGNGEAKVEAQINAVSKND